MDYYLYDDKSSDNSVEIIKKHQDSRIILIEAEKTEELDMLMKSFTRKATEDTFTFLDADDYWEPNFYQK
ncbi:MAG: glycosyltransferase [Cloacibacterium normanense]